MTELVKINSAGKDVTTSLIVAQVFGKEHKNVLRDIENLSCSDTFRRLNFEHTPYVHPQNGQTYKMYEMTKDGFSFLVMGYTGERAGQFKENIATVVGHDYKPWRLFRALAEKYGLTPIGVTYILKEAGLYKGTEETIAKYTQA